jgi:hypothetical protein
MEERKNFRAMFSGSQQVLHAHLTIILPGAVVFGHPHDIFADG